MSFYTNTSTHIHTHMYRMNIHVSEVDRQRKEYIVKKKKQQANERMSERNMQTYKMTGITMSERASTSAGCSDGGNDDDDNGNNINDKRQ